MIPTFLQTFLIPKLTPTNPKIKYDIFFILYSNTSILLFLYYAYFCHLYEIFIIQIDLVLTYLCTCDDKFKNTKVNKLNFIRIQNYFRHFFSMQINYEYYFSFFFLSFIVIIIFMSEERWMNMNKKLFLYAWFSYNHHEYLYKKKRK